MPHELAPSADTGGAAERVLTFAERLELGRLNHLLTGADDDTHEPTDIAALVRAAASLRARLTESEQKLTDAIERERELRGAGGMLANVAFNLAQRGSSHSDFMQTLGSCYRNWDRVVEKHVTALASLTPPEPS